MNALVIIGGAVLAVGLLALLVAVLRRPGKRTEHLTVAALQARLAEENAPSVVAADERLAARSPTEALQDS